MFIPIIGILAVISVIWALWSLRGFKRDNKTIKGVKERLSTGRVIFHNKDKL